jgi:hypothetical protein
MQRMDSATWARVMVPLLSCPSRRLCRERDFQLAAGFADCRGTLSPYDRANSALFMRDKPGGGGAGVVWDRLLPN